MTGTRDEWNERVLSEAIFRAAVTLAEAHREHEATALLDAWRYVRLARGNRAARSFGWNGEHGVNFGILRLEDDAS